MKTDLEKIKMACELRIRGYALDLGNQPKSEYFRGAQRAMLEFLIKLQDIKLIEYYITMKSAKYMSDDEKEVWKELL